MTEIEVSTPLPAAKAGNYGMENIENIANVLLEKFKLEGENALRSLLAFLGCKIEADTDNRRLEVHGTLEVRGPAQWTIYLPSHTGPIHDRFTLAHELGHYVLHSKFGEVPLTASRIFSSNTALDLAEVEADAFALAFLMPKDKLDEAIRKYGIAPEILSAEFGVDSTIAKIRLDSLGL
jgi:predicted transcriptional regulator